MIRLKNSISISFISIVMISLVVSSTYATTENFTVPPQSEVTRSLNLYENDRVSIEFSVIGKMTKELSFYVTDPDGVTVLRYDKIGQGSFSLLANITGTYILHFNNTLPTESKMVTLNYDIEHLILGMPQTLFLTIVVVGIVILMIAAFVAMGGIHL